MLELFTYTYTAGNKTGNSNIDSDGKMATGMFYWGFT